MCHEASVSIQIQAGGLQLYYKETLVMVFFYEPRKIFKNTLKTSANDWFWRIKSLQIFFCKASGFYYVIQLMLLGCLYN